MSPFERKVLAYSMTALTAYMVCASDHNNTRQNLLRECKDLDCIARICEKPPVPKKKKGSREIYFAHFIEFLDRRNVWIVLENHQVTEVHVNDHAFEAKLVNEPPD